MCATDHVPVARSVVENEPVLLFRLEQFLEASHVLVTPAGMDAAVVNHFSDALPVVAGSDLLTCVPNGFMNGRSACSTARINLL